MDNVYKKEMVSSHHTSRSHPGTEFKEQLLSEFYLQMYEGRMNTVAKAHFSASV